MDDFKPLANFADVHSDSYTAIFLEYPKPQVKHSF